MAPKPALLSLACATTPPSFTTAVFITLLAADQVSQDVSRLTPGREGMPQPSHRVRKEIKPLALACSRPALGCWRLNHAARTCWGAASVLVSFGAEQAQCEGPPR